MNFENALSELESLVVSMEEDNTSLEKSLLLYSRGVELVKFCQNHISKAEQTIKILEEELLKPVDSDKIEEL
ncbi:exonuclease VII small subunit [Candidatus Kinetoplastibacterium desouzaii TCC079E]|uniref:Exodeoxyribonuclease 7 small subunit n=1 Tax=Candidatus Kinetoplastidibacterium desouzai TCC079E TaxID=1208919 RepID=M1LS12_9PROT|nr:exodeoxyribonuclease VII small subunit [Candidatus Kinetoplastibacterium desouzaii]AGF46931.1 exonuclease VII small subunit [Candidatus Kinetoplastibacterium desouzaii TCC079E]